VGDVGVGGVALTDHVVYFDPADFEWPVAL
jgi:hypothetical protein